MISDIRFALRLLVKSRGFAAVTLLTLALCIGANTAIFSVVYALMLKPLPYPESNRIVEIYNTYGGAKSSSNVVEYLDYKANAKSLGAFGLWSAYEGMIGEDSDSAAQRLRGVHVTADFFQVLGLQPLVGQYFTLENSRPNDDKVVVLTQSYWADQFHEDPSVVGKVIRVDGDTVTVVGVAPRALEAFDARMRFVRPLVWNPATVNPQNRHSNNPRLFARLKPEATLGQAQAEGDVLERRFYNNAPPATRAFVDRAKARIQMGFIQTERVQPLKSTLLLLQGGVIFVLLIGCVNIANLLLARANGRQSEMAARFSLGATRGTITRQLLLETLVLTTLGTVLGMGIAWPALAALNHYRAQLTADELPFTLDGRVLAFTIAVSVLVALLIGAIPIVHVLRANLMEMIRRSSRGASGGAGVRALSGSLIVGQVAVAFVLLAGAGLLIHSFIRAISVEPGFDSSGVICGRIAIPSAHRDSDTAAFTLQNRVEQTMKEIPGVSSVALSLAVPFRGGLPAYGLTLAADILPPDSPQPGACVVQVSSDYLATLHLRLVEGRFLEREDSAPGHNVFVVDENFARKFFSGRSAIGGRFSFTGRPDKDSDWPTIVGVVRAVPHNGVEDRSGLPFVYQVIGGRPKALTLFMRTSSLRAETIPLLRQKLLTIDPAIALFDTAPLQSFIDSSFDQRRAVTLVIGSYAALALFLSALGLYGVLAYDVSQRTREIGIRGAIGATPFQIVSLVMRQGLLKTALGLAIGIAAAAWLGQAMKSFLFDLSANDPLAYVAVAILLVVVAAVASYLPARRAARINPIEALRAE